MNVALPSIALVQMEVLPGRPDRNVANMCGFIERARDTGAEIVAFPEMCVPGYLLGDVWEVDALVEDFAAWSDSIREASAGLSVLFGNVAVDANRIGEDGRVRKYNAVHVCSDGRFVARAGVPAELPHGIHPKTLHANYRFFDDDRHFYSLRKLAQEQSCSIYAWMQPYEVTLANGRVFRFGVQLCEDIWCADYAYEDGALNTLSAWHANGAEAVFNLSASPWTWQKNAKRNRTVRAVLEGSSLPFFYVNQVGAQSNGKNILVFDGDTTAYAPGGEVRRRARPWTEQMLLCAGDDALPGVQDETAAVYDAALAGLRHLDRTRECENRFLIGVSGGIDSSVVACLLTQAFGPERVFAVNLPTRFNAAVTQDNAQILCAALGVDYLSCPIQDIYDGLAEKIRAVGFTRAQGSYTRLVDENLQARIRGADMLAGIAAKFGLVFTNNGNKTETALGYATLYGDVNGAVAPIADLYKTQVYALAEYLNEVVYGAEVIPCNLLSGETVPSAELSAEQDVTRGLGDPIKYGYHDAVLKQMIEYRRHPVDFMEWFLAGEFLARIGWPEEARFSAYFPTPGDWLEDLEWVDRQLRMNYFKRIQAPPIIVLSKRAFGFDLRESQLPEYHPRRYADLKARVLASAIVV